MPYSESVYKELTRRAINGESVNLWCVNHRHAISEFNDYVGYVQQLCESRRLMPLMPSARKIHLMVSFPSGGSVRFISRWCDARGERTYEVDLNDKLLEVLL